MKRLIGLITFLVVLLTACGSQKPQANISKELGIDVSKGTEVSNFDNHGGFHGDGMTYITLSFSDEKVLKTIEDKPEWKQFPLDETVKALVYGVSNGGSRVGPFLSDENGNGVVPEIENGYYLLIDRQAEPGKATGADILNRSSFNFTSGIYDTDTNTLHFLKLDT